MNQKFLLCLLLPITVVSAMEHVSNEILVYNIGPYLNRLAKNAFRATNKKHYQLILYQSLLNENYAFACSTNNIDTISEWRKKGALRLHEEMYNLFTDNKEHLATRLWSYHNRGLFCINSAFTHGIQLNNKPFITFLLKKNNLSSNSDIITNALAYSKQLEHHKITKTLECYITKEKLPKYTPSFYRVGGSGPPPLQ